jgi:hypothetical protein
MLQIRRNKNGDVEYKMSGNKTNLTDTIENIPRPSIHSLDRKIHMWYHENQMEVERVWTRVYQTVEDMYIPDHAILINIDDMHTAFVKFLYQSSLSNSFRR